MASYTAFPLVQRHSQCIVQWSADNRATVQDMRVDHRGVHVAVAQQFLDRADVLPTLKQARSEWVAQRVRTNRQSRRNTN
jgi:hypothetical protein